MNLLEIGTERIEINLGKVLRKDYTTNHLQILEDQLILHYSEQNSLFFFDRRRQRIITGIGGVD